MPTSNRPAAHDGPPPSGPLPAGPLPAVVTADETLAEVGRLLRRAHEAGRGDEPPAWATGATGRALPGAPPGIVWGHNDVRPGTVHVSGDGSSQLSSSPWAALGDPLWDLAGAAWRWVPLYGDHDTTELGFATGPEVKGRRLRLLCDAYGVGAADRARLLDVVEARMAATEAVLVDPSWADHDGIDVWRSDRGGAGPTRDRWHITEYRDVWVLWLA